MEIVTVCLDAAGLEAARPYLERAQPEHPSLIDEAHAVDALFGIVNIPNSVWIDEQGMIVRPVEGAWPRRERPAGDGQAPPPPANPRMAAMMQEASKIIADGEQYLAALRDWAAKGNDSPYALSPDDVIARSGNRSEAEAMAAAEFELAQYLYRSGNLPSARPHFREAHRLQPDNWTYKRQAWSLEPVPAAFQGGPMQRFWQGPLEGREEEWPYDGDWVKDAQAIGGENYYPRFQP